MVKSSATDNGNVQDIRDENSGVVRKGGHIDNHVGEGESESEGEVNQGVSDESFEAKMVRLGLSRVLQGRRERLHSIRIFSPSP